MVRSAAIAAVMMLVSASFSYAGQSGDYFGMSSGLLILKQRSVTDREGSTASLLYDPGLPVSAFVGRQFESGLRIDGELFYKTAGTKNIRFSGQSNGMDSRVQCIGAMANVYYNYYHRLKDFPFSPYFGLGAGFANVQMSDGEDSRFKYWKKGNDTVLAYQVILGSSIPLYKNTHLDLSYRYLGTGDIKIDRIRTDFDNHNILAGLIYYFR